ncbi:sodium:solute symporter family protein [Intestinibacillus massiliensis]|uniref:sodium:solute symporter family protein n=1 Tax=Intestinibacillus massiliensis TaxID=1871029 RepID=UPI000B35F9D9|nr:sodium:solute symporter family protein [Intestinibacillus massiliensis]
MLHQSAIWIAFAAYLLFLLVVAGYEHIKEKNRSARGFLTAGGSIPWPLLVMTYLASLMSTWVFFAGPGGYYRGGLGYWVSELSYIVLFPVVAHFTMNKVWLLNHARGYTTPADFYDDRFKSPLLRVILSLIFLVSSFPYIASVLVSIGQAAGVATGGAMDYRAVICIVGIVIILYVMIGGMKSVATTDTIQGLLFISLLWVIAAACLLIGFGGSLSRAVSSIWENTNAWFSYPGPDGWVPYGSRLGYPLSCAIGWTIMLPHVFVRSGYSGKDLRTQRKLMVLTPVLQAFVWTGTMVIGLVGIALLPGLAQGDTELIIPYMINNVIQNINPQLAVFLMLAFFIGASAVGISTADSFLLVSSSIVYEDIIHHTLGIELSEKKKMLVIRITIAVIGGISVLLALRPPQLIYTLIMFAIAIVMPLFPILVFAIYWKRATKQAAIVSAVLGTALVLATYFVWDIGGTWYGAIGMLGSTVSMVAVSLLTKPDEAASREFYQALEQTADEFYETENIASGDRHCESASATD